MNDVQNYIDNRNITVDQVGLWDIEYPIVVKDKANEIQHTVAKVDITVMLLPEFKGTHMSRMLEVLSSYSHEITMDNIPEVLRKTREHLNSPQAIIALRFPYFIQKKAPVSGITSMFSANILFSGFSDETAGDSFILGLRVPVTTLCPCSKEISTFGAHNQRSFVTLYVQFKKFIWIEELISVIEERASCEIYPLLKRPDEKFVTEKAFSNPVFAEDVVRNISEKMMADKRIKWFMVETLHLESIHSHNAYARIERFKSKSFLLTEHLRMFKGVPRQEL